jgi:phosphonoacetate hydrolase
VDGAGGRRRSDDQHERAEALERALTDPALAHLVDVVLSRDGDTYRAASARGSVTFTHGPDGTTILRTEGSDPLAEGDATRFAGIDAELAGDVPAPVDEARPHAHDEVAQLFDSPHAPDVAVVHAAAHRFHGNVGEHGSLGTVQRRAPLLLAGPGVRSGGWLDAHARTVDVAPTVAALAGVARRRGRDRFGHERDDNLLARQDGDVLEVVEGTADHVLVVLWDGLNANELRAAIDAGEAPNAAGLVARGTGYDHGMLASYPSATLANHTTLGTGAMPGHSGVLHNEWRCSRTGELRNLLDLAQMFTASDHIGADVETLHEAVHRTRPGAWTGATHEFCDRGADWSSFRAMASGERLPAARRHDEFPRDGEWFERSDRYRFMSSVDETALRCALAFWDDDHPVPDLAFCSFALTDEAGHEGGPHSPQARAAVRDCDERLGRLLGAVERRGVLERTAVVLLADHGMQRTGDHTGTEVRDATEGIDHVLVDQMFAYVV